MSDLLPFFAQITVPGTPQTGTGWKTFSAATIGILIILGVVAVISAVIFIWAAFFRKRRKRRHSYERWHRQKDEAREVSAERRPSGISHRRHRHRRHHRERPRNPTLAETGGLPPIRHPQNPPGSPPP